MASWILTLAITAIFFMGTASANFGVTASAEVGPPGRGDVPDPQLPPDLPFIETIIVRNTGISVPFGRQHFVDPENELKINVQPGHTCTVYILEDPLSEVPGRLSPNPFPCNFGDNNLKYSHFGARKPQLDRVKLQLRYDTEDETYIIPFMMEVRVESKQLEIVITNNLLTVQDLRGISDTIDNSKLEFSYDRNNQMCFVTVFTSATGLPRYGTLTNTIQRGVRIPCDEFLTSSTAYIHTHVENSPSEDYIPMMVEIFDLNNNLLKQEYFQMTVRIVPGEANRPPQPFPGAIMVMEVNQFVMTAITSLELGAEDDGTPFDDIVFNITGPLGEGEGYIVSTDDRNLPLSSFRQGDIVALKIAYVPPAEDSDEERMFSIEFEAVDSELASSAPDHLLQFHISVKPKNTLAPVVTRNTGMTLYEGQSRPFLTSQNLQISDEDNREDVIITPINGLFNGEIKVNGVSGQKFFTIQDLDAGVVTYHHDGSDTYSDNVIFRMTDGENEVEFLFPIYIIPQDDEPPVVNVNTGITVNKGEYYPINPFILSSTDIDSDDLYITYFLEPPFSTEGEIVKRVINTPADPQNWANVNGFYEQVVSEWTQEDIINGFIYYHHIGGVSTDVVMDQMLFRVGDNNIPPNLSPVQTFIAKVLPLDDQPPYLYPGTPLQLTVDEFELTEILKSQLRYTDLHDEDRDLQYTITTMPYDTDTNNPLPAGEIVMFEDPNVVAYKFSQAMINHKKIAYRPPSSELGITPRMIEFAFAVQDTNNNILSGQIFSILLLPVNNQPPIITNAGMTIYQGESIDFSTGILDVTDDDTELSKIRFYVTDEPKHGILMFDNVPLTKGEYFVYDDITSGRITYINNGDGESGDTIGLEVTDGVHEMPITINIKVRTVDDQQQIISLPPGTLGAYVEVPEGSSSLITSNILSTSDPYVKDLMLMFIVDNPPKKGVIENGGVEVNSFTQQDIVNGFISYRHTSGEVGSVMAEDSFNLTFSEMSDVFSHDGNRVTKIEVYVTILPVDSVPPNVTFGDVLLVDEAGKGKLTPNNILMSDPDTNINDITCMIVTPPTNGYVENISPAVGSEKSRIGRPISSFTYMDLQMGHINYVQSIHTSSEPEMDRFTYRCTDGINYSDNYFFEIGITASNDEKPKLFINDLQLLEGTVQEINVIRLNAEDGDEPKQELHFFVVTAPNHGEIVYQGPEGLIPVSNFSLNDIKANKIFYRHDDTETTEDSVEFRLTDGDYDVFGTMPIMIFAQDDETPRLTINNGLNIENEETTIITNRYLKATDLDSIDANLTFTVRYGPEFGVLQLLSPSGVVEQNLTIGSSFQQWQIDEGRIQYVHLGGSALRDLIKFDITDGFNDLIDRYFYVTINKVDNVHPVVVNKGLTLPEGGRMTLTTSQLSTSDINSPDEELIFIVTREPSRGHLESTDFPGVPITSFTQLDLAGNKIYYVHTSDEEVKMDSFQFEVTDGLNSVVRTFRISLSDVDNKKPVVTILPLTLNEGQNKLITPFELRIDDRDTSDERLVVTITQLPVHGNLLFNNSNVVTSFSMEDLNNNLISYQHDGTESTTDSFSFIVSDGTHNEFYVYPQLSTTTRKPQRMQIKINSIDNGAPQMTTNRGGSTMESVGPTGQLGFLITNKYLNSEDRDSSNGGLTYTITVPPKHGYLMNSAMGNVSINNFTQENIDNMVIQYIMNKGTNASSDIFFFSVTDSGGNTLSNQPFRLNWAWISLESEYYQVNETDGSLTIKLKRRGYLGETSFVGIRTEDGQAIRDEDYRGKVGKQVQFNPGQTEGFMRIKILNDNKYEQSEVFSVHLHDPVMGALEFPEVAFVNILDREDESTVYIDIDSTFSVPEDVREILVPIRRSGDLSDELMVMCSTLSGTATGSEPSPVTSFSDYISRVEDDNANFVMFESGEDLAFCRIRIIDDSLYEEAEKFQVKLSNPMGGRVGSPAVVEVEIEADPNDEPSFYFGAAEYKVDESDGYVVVNVWRTGTDLSKMASVTVRSHKSNPVSAVAGEDYHGISTNLDFAPGITMQTVKINILDDIGQPVLEGIETFNLVLRMPMNAVLGDPNSATIFINDAVSDLPKVAFREGSYTVNENDGTATAMIVRTGDITQPSSVRCYSRQGSAQVMMDYDERPNTAASIINFEAGESEKPCTVLLMNDNLYEEKEKFRLVLNHARTSTNLPALVGDQNETLIFINDDGDKPIIKFKEIRYSTEEPTNEDEEVTAKITVVRLGDTSQTSIVRMYTKDGSAKSGYDYDAFSRELVFGFNVSEITVDVDILYDTDRNEMREAFTVHLTQDKNMIAELGDNKAIVYIDQTGGTVAGITFPAPPVVVSLLNYDDATNGIVEPVPGYPVVCVTPCNPKHPDFAITGSICTTEGINDTLTQFRWMVSAPSAENGATSPLKEVSSNTFFTSTNQITLDSIYFAPGSRVQCSARAVNNLGDPGREYMSDPATISKTEGLCMPRTPGAVGAEPFTAKLRYTGPADPDHPNMIKLTVTMPHTDGMLPVISTRQLSNFELTLSEDGLRVGSHQCSNLLDFDEVRTNYGFITKDTKNPNVVGETKDYQFSSEMRTDRTLRFYRNLDMDACLWEFTNYYDMSELLDNCGGQIGTDGQVLDLVQSYVSLDVPLYVSYIFHSPVGIGGWQHFDLQSNLRLTFVYDTSILWENGIGTSQADSSSLQGYLYPTSMRIEKNGRLVVDFRTEARFRGQFVLAHPNSDIESSVFSAEHPGVTYDLDLIRTEPTFAEPEQLWQFTSSVALSDYSGSYTVRLVPCSTPVGATYSEPIVCNPNDPIEFQIPIRFQQVSDPVPAEFSLNSEFVLMNKESLWLSDGSMGFGEGSDAAFAPGDTIYGRIHVDPVQNLGDGFYLTIEKVFLCSGLDGYIPKYNPANDEYGCVADTPNLLYSYKILDRAAPTTTVDNMGGIKFNASLAVDDKKALALAQLPNADGFSMSTKPLFEASTGRQNFLHAIYTIRSKENAGRGIGKRSIEYHSLSNANQNRKRRQANNIQENDIQDLSSIGTDGLGTNIHRIAMSGASRILTYDNNDIISKYEKGVNNAVAGNSILPVIIGVCGAAILLCLVLIIVLVLRRKKTIPAAAPTTVYQNGSAKVVTSAGNDDDNTEV